MANVALNNITFDITNFNGTKDTFINLFFNDEAKDENIIELKSDIATDLFSNEVLNKYMQISTRTHHTLSNLIEMINKQLDIDLTLNDVNTALFGFQRYDVGFYDAGDGNEYEVNIYDIQSKTDIAFPLFYLLAYLGVKTIVHESLDKSGNCYRKNYQVYLDNNGKLIETEDEYFTDLTEDEFKQAISTFI